MEWVMVIKVWINLDTDNSIPKFDQIAIFMVYPSRSYCPSQPPEMLWKNRSDMLT